MNFEKIKNINFDDSYILEISDNENELSKKIKDNNNCYIYKFDLSNNGEEYNSDIEDRIIYERIINFDKNNLIENVNMNERQFDYIIANCDVNILNKKKIIKKITSLLKLNGKILINIRNLGFIDSNEKSGSLRESSQEIIKTNLDIEKKIRQINKNIDRMQYEITYIEKEKILYETKNKLLKKYINDNNIEFLNCIIVLTLNNKKECISVYDSDDEINFYKDVVDFYKKESNYKDSIINNMNEYQNNLKYENTNLIKKIDELSEIINDDSYKLYKYFEKIIRKIVPKKSVREKIIQIIIGIFKYIFISIGAIIIGFFNLIYKILPKRFKRKIKNIIYNSRRISKLCKLPYNMTLPKRVIIDGVLSAEINNLTYTNKKIAVHLHLYYVDLAEEFYTYLLNIPYIYDLYISIPKDESVMKIKNKFKKMLNINKIIVKKSENCGRDYGPMFVLFGKYLKEYDYIMHIHSKKSLRTGNEQTDWRQYLLNNLLGSREMVMQYFSIMENYNVGIAYPEAYCGDTYIGHTYLGVQGLARDFYKKLGLKYEDSYLDFSVGSMFWCKSKLLKEIFDANLTWEDFGKDKGQSDGTLEYVIERIFDPLAKKHNYNFATYNPNTNYFYLNKLDKNFNQYKCKNIENTYNSLMEYPIVTFDIFDTLVTRMIYEPDDVFKIIDKIVSKKFNLKENYFIKMRKESEYNVRLKKEFAGDCDINEIYEEFANRTKLPKKTCNEIKQIEIDTDIKFITPRKDMLEIYNRLLKNNKQIILISDMYYTKNIIERILEKCGYKNYYRLFVSSETGLRKDNGTVWEWFYKNYDNSIHVGDNEESDIHQLFLREKPCFHVMMGRKMYENSPYYNKQIEKTLENRIMLGLITNKSMFNSPFALNLNRDGGIINNIYDYGYSILGPLFLYFMQWLINNSKDKKILFVSREGYYLQRIYKKVIANSKKVKEEDNVYFLTSRRAISFAKIKSLDDIEKIFRTPYNGNIKELFYYRLGFILDDEYENINIYLPYHIDYVMSIAEKYINQIISNSSKDYKNYIKYINSVIDLEKDDLMIVDLGYSGSVQYDLSKLLNKKISGAYFIVSDNIKPISIGAEVLSCFNKVDYDKSFDKIAIGKNSMFLESLLTSPKGQLVRFDDELNPVYLNEKNKDVLMEKLDKIYEGIIDFIDDMSNLNYIDIVDIKLDKEWILKNFEYFINNSDSFNSELIETLKVEDFYCSNNIINIKKR